MIDLNLAPDGYIRVHRFVSSTNVLGPGERSVLWVQGCLRNCPGCMSQASRKLDRGKNIKINDIYDQIIEANLKEVTVSGGEPFLQAKSLGELTELLHKADVGIIIYTGNKYEDLIAGNNIHISKVLQNIDILIDGEYINELNEGQSMVGSSNQRVIQLSNRYSQDLINQTYGHNERNVEFLIDNSSIFVVGVPNKDDFEKIVKIIDD